MKTYVKLIILAFGMTAFLASCDTCKTCKKDSEVTVTVCKGGSTQSDMDNTVSNYQSGGYTCQ